MLSRLTTAGISVKGDVPQGTHLCYFYETKRDLLEASVPFFQAGLENREFCLWMVYNPVTEEDAVEALRHSVPDLDRYLAEGAIEICVHPKPLFDGDVPESGDGVRYLHDKTDHALARGYAGMRVAGSPACPQLGRSIAHHRMIALCLFPLAESSAVEIVDAARTHQFVVARREGDWEIMEPPEIRLAKAEITKLNEQLEQRVEERTRALEAVNEDLRQEIARREAVEEDLRQQKEILQTIFDHLPVMINFVDQNHQIKLVNREWERTIGWSVDEIQRQNIDILVEGYPDPEYREYVRDFVVNSNAEWADFKTTVRDGRVIDTSWAMLHLSDGTGIGIGKDITNRKRAEEELRASEERFRQIAENIHEVFWLADADLSRVLYLSPPFQNLIGRPFDLRHQDAGIETLLTLVHPADLPGVMEILRPPGREFDIEFRIQRDDGSVRWVRDRGFPIRSQDGQIYRIGGVAEDITDRKEAEDRLKASSEQLRALSASLQSAREEEAARIAHQIHDDLGGILTGLRWELEALEKMIHEPADPGRLKAMQEKLATMLGLTDTTINVVRRIASELRPSILDDLGLVEAIEWQTQQFQARTGIECRCDCSLQSIPLGDPQSTAVFRIVQEALTNILRHAQATRVSVAMKEENGVLALKVSDNGRGITPAEVSNKKSLGLLGMRERAHLIGGHVDIAGSTGGGTTLHVRVPLAGGAA